MLISMLSRFYSTPSSAPVATLDQQQASLALTTPRIHHQGWRDMRQLTQFSNQAWLGVKWLGTQVNRMLGFSLIPIHKQDYNHINLRAQDFANTELTAPLTDFLGLLDQTPTQQQIQEGLVNTFCDGPGAEQRMALINKALQTLDQPSFKEPDSSSAKQSHSLIKRLVHHSVLAEVFQFSRYCSVGQQQRAIRNLNRFPINLFNPIGKALQYHQTISERSAHELPLKATLQLANELQLGTHDSTIVRESLSQPDTIEIIRALLTQDDFSTALQQLKDHFPTSFHGSLDQFANDYQLAAFSKASGIAVNSLDNDQLKTALTTLGPSAVQRFDRKFAHHLENIANGDHLRLNEVLNSNIEQLQQQLNDTLERHTSLLTGLSSATEPEFVNFLKENNLFPNNAPQTLKTILFHQQSMVRAGAEGLSHLNTLLVALGVPLQLSQENTSSPLQNIRASLCRLEVARETKASLMKVFERNKGLDHFDLATRFSCANAFLTAFSESVQLETAGICPVTRDQNWEPEKKHIDALWAITSDLVKASDRSIVVNAQNSAGQASDIIFSEDGACIDEDGQLLVEGDEKNLALRQAHSVAELFEAKSVEVREQLRNIIGTSWTQLAQVVADHPSDAAFAKLLDHALLPKDIQQLLLTLLNELLPQDIRETTLGHAMVTTMARLDTSTRSSIVNVLSEQQIDGIANQLTQLIKNLNPYEQMPFFKTFADTLRSSLSGSKTIRDLSITLTKGYYPNICLEDKRKLATAVLTIGRPNLDENQELSDESLIELIGAMTQAGGPCFQKSMQLFRNDIKIPSIRKALEAMDSDVAQMDPTVVRQIIEQDLPQLTDPKGQHFQLLDEANYQALRQNHGDQHWPSLTDMASVQLRCLGSATIAQTHQVYVQAIDQEGRVLPKAPVCFAIKVQRPKIVHRIAREMQALQQISGIAPNVARTLLELQKSITSETDFNRELQQGRLMKKLYKSREKNGINVVDMIGAHHRILAQSFNPGSSFTEVWKRKSARGALDLQQQATYLQQHSHRMESLIAGFAKASFVGTKKHALPIVYNQAAKPGSKLQDGFYIYRDQQDHFHLELVNDKQLQHWSSAKETTGEGQDLSADSQHQNDKLTALLQTHFTGHPLPKAIQGQVNNLARSLLNQQVLMTGEGYIDSDRHAGNLLHARGADGKDHMTIIDTGAGTIITAHEREGMLQMAIGIFSGEVQLLMSGLRKLIPDMDELDIKDPKAFEHELSSCIGGGLVDDYKIHDVFDFLLDHELIPGHTNSEQLFAVLFNNNELTEQKTHILNFKKPHKSLPALQAYLASQLNNLPGYNPAVWTGPMKSEFQSHIQTLDYGRVFAGTNRKGVNPTKWLTDGQNSLLLILTLQRMVNVLYNHGVYAPESIIQLNRGAKFIEDQLKHLNTLKSQVFAQLKGIQQQFPGTTIPRSTTLALQQSNLGQAFVNGIMSGRVVRNGINATGRHTPAVVASLIKGPFKAH